MSPDEWVAIVDEVNQRIHKRWTLDRAAKYGVQLKRYDHRDVYEAALRLIAAGDYPTGHLIRREITRKPSKWGARIEARHLELYPRGCLNRQCELCYQVVDMPPDSL